MVDPVSGVAGCLVVCSAARIATEQRKILANMGHPQPATPLFCDNEVTVGIAADTVSQRMSKATDMRLH